MVDLGVDSCALVGYYAKELREGYPAKDHVELHFYYDVVRDFKSKIVQLWV